MRVKCIDDWDDWNGTRISITKGKVYEICGASSSDGRFAIRGDNGKLITFVCDIHKNKFFEIVKEGKMEEIRIVRKLEELDGLENGLGLRFVTKRECHEDGIYDFLILTTEKKEFQSWDLTDGKALEAYSDFFKAMGFKFEYKPTRTLNEVVEEMKLETDDVFEDGENYKLYEVAFEKSAKHYKIRLAETVGAPVFIDDKLAQKYADELNEIIGKVK